MVSVFSNEEHLEYRLHAANLCFHFEFCVFGMTSGNFICSYSWNPKDYIQFWLRISSAINC